MLLLSNQTTIETKQNKITSHTLKTDVEDDFDLQLQIIRQGYAQITRYRGVHKRGWGLKTPNEIRKNSGFQFHNSSLNSLQTPNFVSLPIEY